MDGRTEEWTDRKTDRLLTSAFRVEKTSGPRNEENKAHVRKISIFLLSLGYRRRKENTRTRGQEKREDGKDSWDCGRPLS